MPAFRSLGTLKQILDSVALEWPMDFFSLPDPPAFLQRIYVLSWESVFRASVLQTRLQLAIQGELSLRLPGFDGVSVVLGAAGDGLSLVSANFTIGERSSLELLDFPFVLRFEQQLLKPAPSATQGEGTGFVEIGARGRVVVTSNFDLHLYLGPLSLSPCVVGDSGLVISASGVLLDLSRSASPPEVVAAGFDESFMGLYIGRADVQFPPGLAVDLPSGLVMKDCAVGAGGFSGSLSATWTPALRSDGSGFQGEGAGEVFGIPFALRQVSLQLRRNCFVKSSIEGLLLLPFFGSVLCCRLGLGSNGDFALALAPQQDLPEGMPQAKRTDQGEFVFNVHDMADVRVSGIELVKEGDVVALRLAGGIQPKIGGFDWPEFEIKALTIDSKGHVSIDGGWIDLPTQKTLNFHGFAVEVSKIGFGSEDDGTRWIGFSGGLKLCEGIPMKGAVEGLRVCWKGSKYWLEFKGAEVAFEIPDSIAFAGRVEFLDDPEGPTRGFKGGGKLRIIPIGLEIDAQVVIGKNEKNPAYTFFYFFIESQLPAGIPLFSTGVAIYGLGGLVAYNMEPSKTPEQAWYEDWYKHPAPGVSDASKWADKREAFALGASVTSGTASDDGYAVSARTLFVLVMPGPVVLIEGKGSLLQKRAALTADPPPFSALAVLDGRVGQFLLNLEARYPSPPEGITAKLIRIEAGAEAFFDFHDWRKFHLFLGERDPRAKRIRAEILSLFEANAYLMLFSNRLEVGAWIGYDARWKLGPVRVILAAWMDGNALVSWKPVQFHGDLTLFGELAIRAFGVGLGISAGATVEVDVPTPYRVFAELFLKVNLPWPLPDLEPRVKLEWKEDVPPPTPIPLSTVGIEHLKVSEKWELARCPRYDTAGDVLWYEDATPTAEDAAALEAASPLVPLDAKIVLSFARNVEDAALVGLNPSGVLAPERVGNYEFRYRLVQVQLDRRSEGDSSGAWQTVAGRAEGSPEKDKDRLWGSWLAVTSDTATAAGSQIASMTKLLLYAKSPFEYARETIDDTYYDDFALWEPDYGITRVDPPRQVCVDDFKSVWQAQKGQELVMPEIRVGDVIIIGQNLQVRRKQRGESYVYFLQIGSHTQRAAVVLLPTKVRKMILHLVGSRGARVSLYDGAKEVRSWKSIPDIAGEGGEFIFPGRNPFDFDKTLLFDVMVIEGQIGLSMLCYVTKEEADRVLTEVVTAEHAGSAGDAYTWSEENELLLPASHYRVTITTEALRRRKGHDDWVKIQTFSESSYFRTADPPGMTEPAAEGQMSPSAEGEHYPNRGPLKDLSAYVRRDKLIPPEGAMAFYRSYDVGAEFNEPYVETMYLLAGKPLVVCVYDNNGEEVVGSTPDVIGAHCGWNENEDQPPPSRADQEWAATTQRAEMRRSNSVAIGGEWHSAARSVVPHIDLSQLPKKKGIWVGGDEFVLKPGAQYRATVSAMVPQVIIPLDSAGGPIVRNDSVQYARVDSGASHFVSGIRDDWGQAEAGYKVVSDGRRVVATGYRASQQAQKQVMGADVAQALREALDGAQPPKEPKAVFSWSFVTSRFASFVDHVHSFVDAAWDLRKTMGLDAWPQDRLRELRSLIEAGQIEENQLFEKAAACFDVSGRPLPERLEISVLEDGAGRYGLLVESPEPIQWQKGNKGRVSLEIGHSTASEVATGLAYGPVKLIGCNLAGDEWVEVLAQTDVDLAGLRIERVVDYASTELFYVFPEGVRACAGTQLRVHAGRRPSSAQADADRKHVYAERTEEMLNDGGDVLRVVDNHGKEIHRRRFVPRSFAPLQGKLLASDSDGTRTFVFIRDGDRRWKNLQDGLYRLTWWFRRDAGVDLPVLWRHGSKSNEVAVIDFQVPVPV